MKKSCRYGIALLSLGVGVIALAGTREGGVAELEAECVGGGGISYASAGSFMLGGTFGQNSMIAVSTNVPARQLHSGFWKAECPCDFVDPGIDRQRFVSNRMAITFSTLTSNRYQLTYIAMEEGGLRRGVHAITNDWVPPFIAGNGMGSTTVWSGVLSATNRARYFMIRCE